MDECLECQTLISGSALTLKDSNVTDNEGATSGGGMFAWESVITVQGNSHVTHNVAPQGGGVFLLGGKARLETGALASADIVTDNFARVDPDISTRGTVGVWADVCKDGTVCTEFACGTDSDGVGPEPVCGDETTGTFTLLGCKAGEVLRPGIIH